MVKVYLLFMEEVLLKKLGLYDKVMKELKENNIEVYELAGVEPNPRHTTVNKGAKSL